MAAGASEPMADAVRHRPPPRATVAEFGGPASPSAASDPGSDPRLEELCSSYLADLARGVRDRFGAGPPDPEDVAQEAFRRVFEKGDTSGVKNLKGFLWRTARNIVLDAKKITDVRSKYDFEMEQLLFPLKGDISSPETVMLAKEQLRAVNALLREMPEKRRRALILYRVEGLTLEEVARRLRLSRTAVSNHIAKAHAKLNAHFVEDADG